MTILHKPFDRLLITQADACFVHRFSVLFQDVDAAGVVFFARFFDYVHNAHVSFLSSRGVDLADVLEKRTWALPLTHAAADFMMPLRFGDAVEVSPVVAKWHESELQLGFRVLKQERLVAISNTTHVLISPDTRKRIAVPNVLREVFLPLEILPV